MKSIPDPSRVRVEAVQSLLERLEGVDVEIREAGSIAEPWRLRFATN